MRMQAKIYLPTSQPQMIIVFSRPAPFLLRVNVVLLAEAIVACLNIKVIANTHTHNSFLSFIQTETRRQAQ
jgi:hypothetical protein